MLKARQAISQRAEGCVVAYTNKQPYVRLSGFSPPIEISLPFSLGARSRYSPLLGEIGLMISLIHARSMLQQVYADGQHGSHSRRSAARSLRRLELSFRYVLNPSLLPIISKGEFQTRQNDTHS